MELCERAEACKGYNKAADEAVIVCAEKERGMLCCLSACINVCMCFCEKPQREDKGKLRDVKNQEQAEIDKI